MKIAQLIIGDEILQGRIRDENGPWLSNFLKQKGLGLDSITILPDDEDRLQVEILKTWEEADIIITTGGPGEFATMMEEEFFPYLQEHFKIKANIFKRVN